MTDNRPKRTQLRVLALWILLVGSAQAANKPAPAIDFNREIRPILSENCFKCHGPDDQGRKAKLRFDRKEDAFKPAKSGDLAIVPGDPAKSKLIERITNKDPDEIMPPTKTGKKLTARQIELLTRWIAEGAKWQEHWAYIKPERPPVPQVKNTKWPRNEIDSFILARLEKEGLKPSPVADKATLTRRAALDVTGLPPTPQEVDAMLADKSPQAYDKLVDRLLSSPDYGEQMAHYWLDAARYADSHGYHIDSDRSMWKWRDWVIEAFNKNMPFDQFTVEQLAGDLLPEASLDQKIASGYVRCNMSTGEGGAIVEEYQAKYTFDRVETTSTIWLGLTMTCARCHTHKYDPITHREYFGLYSLFNNLNESVMDGNKPNPEPSLKLPTKEQTAKQEQLKKQVTDGQAKLDAPMPEMDAKQTAWETKWHQRLSTGWSVLSPETVKSTSTNGTQFKILDDESVLVEGPNPESDVHEISVKLKGGTLAALQLEVLPHESLPNKSGARADDGRFRLSEFEAEIIAPPGKPAETRKRDDVDGEKTIKVVAKTGDAPEKTPKEDTKGKPKKLKFTQAVADSAEDKFEVAKAIDGKPDTGWGIDANAITNSHTAIFLLGEPMKVAKNSELRVRLRYEASKSKRAIGHFRLATAQNDELVRLLNPPKLEPWQEIGPFKTENAKVGLTNIYEPEKEIDLKKSYPGVREEVKWKAKPAFDDGKSNLLVEDLHGVHGAYYLYRTLKVPEARKIEVSLRADGLFKLWANDKVVLEQKSELKPGENPPKATIDLKKGENKLLAKIVTVQGAAYFTFDKNLEDADSVPADIAAVLVTTAKPSGSQKGKVQTYFRRANSPEFKSMFESVEKWREEDAGIEKSIPTTMVAKEMDKTRDTFELMRGEYDKKGDKIEPGVPSILPPWPKDTPTNRLGFARWLVDPSHPLTARVTVNRLWQQYFGLGLVKTAEDFGVQGERPSHPELLDWLATELVRTGWDVKRLQKLILTSAAYRQSSRLTPDSLARDPENRLIARGPRYRMDAEMVRDTALAVSGLLLDKHGGRSVKPYQPPGLWEAVSYNNAQKYVPDTDEGQYRRSLYIYWKRQSPPPNMMLFDAPTREYCVVRRLRTNTPLQALVLMNDPQFVEASRALAQRMMTEAGEDPKKRIAFAFRLATARQPGADETKVLLDVFNRQLADFRKDKSAAEKLLGVGSFKAKPGLEASELAAWATIASMILNLDETVTKG